MVFVLREVFQHSYRSIAAIAGKSEAACRQLMVRARAALHRARHAPPARGAVAQEIVTRFIEAVLRGDESALLGILSRDAILIGDGGGKVPSVLNPIYGADRIVRFFAGILRKHPNSWDIRPAMVNSGAGVLTFLDGQLSSVVSVSIDDEGRIAAIYSVSNPDKIMHAQVQN